MQGSGGGHTPERLLRWKNTSVGRAQHLMKPKLPLMRLTCPYSMVPEARRRSVTFDAL